MTCYLTLSETESCLRKVARACGLDWGIAEEAGKAARWLAAFKLPGPETMYRHLRDLRGLDYANFAPNCEFEPWQARGGILCPVVAGAALADLSATMLDGQPKKLGRTAYPLLLAPALGQAARFHQTAFIVCWAGVRLECYADGLTISGKPEQLVVTEVQNVCCCREDIDNPELKPASGAYALDDDLFKRIDALAFKTYVPASEQSRAGAGAGLTDND